MKISTFAQLAAEIRDCRSCAGHLPLGPRPVVQMATTARLLIAGQAPGRRVHTTGIPFNDPSGDRLRQWLGIDASTFLRCSSRGLGARGILLPRDR